ncbi:MAG: EAL domain-containing protein [Pseudomonadota bacterium]
MTLRRQLFLAISVVFLVVFAGLLALSIHNTREYLQQQLASHGQDAATALSYPLAEALAKNDKALAEVQVLAMFDRGYYQKIIVRAADGSGVIDKQLPQRVENVPLWFTQLLALDTAPGEAFVAAGWRQLGKVIVVSQPTFAYEHLWRSVMEMSAWMLAAYLAALAATSLLLRIILNPLRQIEDAALAIRDRRFVQIALMPKARELKRVVVAMNDMSRRVGEALDAEISRSEAYRREAYVDAVTGFENRRSFDLRLAQLLDQPGEFDFGVLITLELDEMKEFNNELGYRAGDLLLREVADCARALLGQRAAILSRSGGTAFAFLCLYSGEEDGADYAPVVRQLQEQLAALLAQGAAAGRVWFSLGCAHLRAGEARGKVLARADLAVETARHSGHNGVATLYADEGEINSTGSFGWRMLIENALAENRWALTVQPVMSLRENKLLHHEVMSSLIDHQGNAVAASQFLPMALRHKLMASVDRALVSMVVDSIAAGKRDLPQVAVNIASQSIDDAEFKNWLGATLHEMKGAAARLSFEVSEFGYTRNVEAMRAFAAVLRGAGARFGVDHFGLVPGALAVLRALPPDYIKLDGSLVREAADNASSREHLRSIVHMAASLDIEVIAHCVETAAVVAMLIEDKVDAGQGFHFGAPTAM